MRGGRLGNSSPRSGSLRRYVWVRTNRIQSNSVHPHSLLPYIPTDLQWRKKLAKNAPKGLLPEEVFDQIRADANNLAPLHSFRGLSFRLKPPSSFGSFRSESSREGSEAKSEGEGGGLEAISEAEGPHSAWAAT